MVSFGDLWSIVSRDPSSIHEKGLGVICGAYAQSMSQPQLEKETAVTSGHETFFFFFFVLAMGKMRELLANRTRNELVVGSLTSYFAFRISRIFKEDHRIIGSVDNNMMMFFVLISRTRLEPPVQDITRSYNLITAPQHLPR